MRDKFVECELPLPVAETTTRPQKTSLTAQEKLYRVDARLRRVVTKACRNSQPAAMVVKTLEAFVMVTFGRSSKQLVAPPMGQWWSTLLTEQPTVTERRDGRLTATFLFDAASGSGGFHRLLLHAICQYHGLQAVCKMMDVDGRSNRVLLVTGETFRHKHMLLDQLIEDSALVNVLEEPWTLAEESKVAEEGEWAVVQS